MKQTRNFEKLNGQNVAEAALRSDIASVSILNYMCHSRRTNTQGELGLQLLSAPEMGIPVIGLNSANNGSFAGVCWKRKIFLTEQDVVNSMAEVCLYKIR